MRAKPQNQVLQTTAAPPSVFQKTNQRKRQRRRKKRRSVTEADKQTEASSPDAILLAPECMISHQWEEEGPDTVPESWLGAELYESMSRLREEGDVLHHLVQDDETTN